MTVEELIESNRDRLSLTQIIEKINFEFVDSNFLDNIKSFLFRSDNFYDSIIFSFQKNGLSSQWLQELKKRMNAIIVCMDWKNQELSDSVEDKAIGRIIDNFEGKGDLTIFVVETNVQTEDYALSQNLFDNVDFWVAIYNEEYFEIEKLKK